MRTSIALTTLASLAAAFPAGGPAIKPIPSSCTVTNPLPTGTSFEPSDSAKADLLYSAYYPTPSTNKTKMAEQCLEQCYGYGDSTQCKAAFWAENVPTPAGWYGTPGGQLDTACLMFTRPLVAGDFVDAPAGEATDAYTRNLAC